MPDLLEPAEKPELFRESSCGCLREHHPLDHVDRGTQFGEVVFPRGTVRYYVRRDERVQQPGIAHRRVLSRRERLLSDLGAGAEVVVELVFDPRDHLVHQLLVA